MRVHARAVYQRAQRPPARASSARHAAASATQPPASHQARTAASSAPTAGPGGTPRRERVAARQREARARHGREAGAQRRRRLAPCASQERPISDVGRRVGQRPAQRRRRPAPGPAAGRRSASERVALRRRQLAAARRARAGAPAQRGQPQQRVGRRAGRDQARQRLERRLPPAARPAARRVRPSGATAPAGSGAARMRFSSLQTRSARQAAPGPARRRAAPRSVAGSGGAGAVAGLEAEEAQDAEVVLGDARAPGRRRSGPGRPRGRRCRRNSRTPRRPGVIDMALMVKSRRAASSRQSSVQATSAWRPSVASSRRSVVTSKPRWPLIAVTVPCLRPVGADFSPAASQGRDRPRPAGPAWRGRHRRPARPASASRTQPPTRRAPRQRVEHGGQRGVGEEGRAARCAAPASLASRRVARHDPAVPHLRRHVVRPGRQRGRVRPIQTSPAPNSSSAAADHRQHPRRRSGQAARAARTRHST